MHLFGSERGLLATPDRCGTYAVDSTFTPWDSLLPEQTSTQFFELDEGPERDALSRTRLVDSTRPSGPVSPIAGPGVHSPFTFDTTRPDGDQNASGIDISTPRPGFTASLRGVPYCPEATIAQLQAPDYSGRAELSIPCLPAARARSESSTPAPAPVPTRSMSTAGSTSPGPYKGAPLSLVTVVPAVSGPYDLGNIVVRTAVQVDEETAQVERDHRPATAADRRDSAARPSHPAQPRPAGLHPQPDQLRSVRGRLGPLRR